LLQTKKKTKPTLSIPSIPGRHCVVAIIRHSNHARNPFAASLLQTQCCTALRQPQSIRSFLAAITMLHCNAAVIQNVQVTSKKRSRRWMEVF
jgi:hypothetical protein